MNQIQNQNQFTAKNNIDLLWDVLLDENYVKKMNDRDKLKLKEIFHDQRNIFYEKEKKNNYDLFSINKKFLTSFIEIINSFKNENNHNQDKKEKEKEKEKVKEKEMKYLYKIEDIQNQRQNDFEKELAEKKVDFENFITINKPPQIDFSEKIEDTKIKGMEELIAQTIAQRNYEISQIQNQNQNQNQNPIKPHQEEKQILNLKQIKIKEQLPSKHEIINLKSLINDHTETKKISWNDTNEIKFFNKDDILLNTDIDNENDINNEFNVNILSKLKKIPINNNNNDSNSTLELIKKMHKFNVTIKDEVSEYKERVLLLERKIEMMEKKYSNKLPK